MRVKIYVEGGGDRNHALSTECRRGFRTLFEKLRYPGPKPAIVACGGRLKAFESFRNEIESGNESYPMLLVDSEAPVTANDPWRHVAERQGDGWKKPLAATAEQLHFMVQTMEAWFYCDPMALVRFYGPKFNEQALRARKDVENIPKVDLFDGLKRATKDCPKGEYSKGRHSFQILASIDPEKIRARSAYAGRLFHCLGQLPGQA